MRKKIIAATASLLLFSNTFINVSAANISASLLQGSTYNYQASGVKPDVRVFSDGKEITSKCQISYLNNRKAGQGNVTITYQGTTLNKPFMIRPEKNNINSIGSLPDGSGFRITWNKATIGTTGYQVLYSKDKAALAQCSNADASKGVYSWTQTDLKDQSENFTYRPVNGETWYVKIRSFSTKDGKKTSTHYGYYSSIKSVTVTDLGAVWKKKVGTTAANFSAWPYNYPYNAYGWSYSLMDAKGQCTAYCWGRANELAAQYPNEVYGLPYFSNNNYAVLKRYNSWDLHNNYARMFADYADYWGIPTISLPKKNTGRYIAPFYCYTQNLGHVVFIEYVNSNGGVYYSQANAFYQGTNSPYWHTAKTSRYYYTDERGNRIYTGDGCVEYAPSWNDFLNREKKLGYYYTGRCVNLNKR